MPAKGNSKVDMHELGVFLRLKPTAKDCADFFKCSIDTVERAIKAHTISEENPTGLTFAEFRDQNMVHTRMTLIQTALNKAKKGDNVMLIFCLKNLCGWRDVHQPEIQIDNNVTFKVGWADDDSSQHQVTAPNPTAETNQ